MRLFTCTHCGQLLYFENSVCEKCRMPLGFLSDQLTLFPLTRHGDNSFSIYNHSESIRYRCCINSQFGVCNWLVPEGDSSGYCTACRLNRTIPNLDKDAYRQRWNVIENAKHRLVYQLLRLQLPIKSKFNDPENGLIFDFMADDDANGEQKILTGHDNGVITLNIAEADDVEREMARKGMAELYRTVLGHFRHEIGHYYWDQLIDGSPYQDECRQLFGDDRQDYGEALNRHYKEGAPYDWNARYISAYASTHPWEDWAETWAHYLHIIDTLETGYSFGISVHPGAATGNALQTDITSDPYGEERFELILSNWLPLTFALNSLNRSMGLHDLYPFIIPPAVVGKLTFIHKVCFERIKKSLWTRPVIARGSATGL